MSEKPNLFQELQRRRVFRAAVVYAVVAFVVAQAADLLTPALLLPDWTYRLVVVLLLLGFPVAMVLAWSFDITPQGVQRTGTPASTGEAGKAAAVDGDGACADTPSGRSRPLPKAAGYVGIGIIIALIGFGGYAYFGPGPSDPDAPAGADRDARHTIAVLPLTNLAGGEENEYFADGITEDILTNLALVPDFTVISRTSVMRYKGSTESVPEIARELGAGYVLEGSVRRDRDRVRVVVQLIEPGTDTPMWGQTLDRRIEDIFALQSEIAHAVVEALQVRLTGGVGERIARAPTEDLDAYDLFLRGRDLAYQYTLPAMSRAIELFDEAIALDPDFALAHAAQGGAHAVTHFNYGADREHLDSAIAAARRAIALQPDLGDGYRALGTALLGMGRFAEGIAALERAIDLNPSDGAAINNLGLAYSLVGEWDRAIEFTRRSLIHDPALNYLGYGNLAGPYRLLGLYDRAEDVARRALELRPGNWVAELHLAWLEHVRGDHAAAVDRATGLHTPDADPRVLTGIATLLVQVGEGSGALPLLERIQEVSPGTRGMYYHAPAVQLAYLVQRAGDPSRARRLLDDAERRAHREIDAGNTDPVVPYTLAGAAAVRGDPTAALDWLEAAVERGWNHPGTRHDPILAALRNDARFRAIVDGIDRRIETMRRRVEREGG